MKKRIKLRLNARLLLDIDWQYVRLPDCSKHYDLHGDESLLCMIMILILNLNVYSDEQIKELRSSYKRTKQSFESVARRDFAPSGRAAIGYKLNRQNIKPRLFARQSSWGVLNPAAINLKLLRK